MGSMSDSVSTLLRLAGVKGDELLAIYPYGSRVYGTYNEKSDRDYILVYEGDDTAKDAQQYDSRDKSISVHTYCETSWKEHLVNHKIFVVECHSIMPMVMFPFTLHLPTLRKEISAKASNSWVKCKKKIEVENDYHTAIKSLFHSFRIPMFGIQIARHGRVVDFGQATPMWEDELKELLNEKPSWTEIAEHYKSRHNALMSEFRKVAEKV